MNNFKGVEIFLTQSKYTSYQNQLTHMENEVLAKMSKMLASSPGSGMGRPLDLPIHDVAKRFYSEIDKLKYKLSNARIIDEIEKPIESLTIELGASVSIKSLVSGEEDTFIILGADETDPAMGKISFLSPLGKALIGKSKGEVIMLPNGERFEISKIEYNSLDFDYPITDWNHILDSLAT